MRKAVALGMLAAMAGVAWAQEVPGQDQDLPEPDIVVTGQRAVDRATARAFVASMTVSKQFQLARFADPVCPEAVGFTPEVAAIIVARFRKVAQHVGARVDPAPCRGNIAIIADRAGAELIKTYHANHPEYFQGMERSDYKRLIESPGPVWNWSVTSILSKDGRTLDAPITSNRPMNSFVNPPIGGRPPAPDLSGVSMLDVKSSSIVNFSSKRVTGSAYIVIDSSAISDKTVLQLTDYAVMRTLANTRPVAGAAGLTTILALFDPAAQHPPSVTRSDVAYLRALYSAPPERKRNAQLELLTQAVQRATDPKRASADGAQN